MAVQSETMTVGDEPVRLTATADDANPGQSVMVKNLDADATVMLGGPDVSWSTGWPLGPFEVVSLSDLASQEVLYAVAADGSAVEVALLQVGV